jgi:hypothetical protein
MHDPANHFATSVPLTSATCPMLLNAILALSARHLSISNSIDRVVALQYHQACLAEYIPAVGQSNDSALLAATVLLRTFEELDQDGRDDENYLLGGSRLFSTPNLALEGGLRQACFWIYLRTPPTSPSECFPHADNGKGQDIYIAFVTRRPVRTDLDHHPHHLIGDDDWTFANRITLLTAQVLRFSFSGIRSGEEWARLKAEVDAWWHNRPYGFRGIWSVDRDPSQERWWPEVWVCPPPGSKEGEKEGRMLTMRSLHSPATPPEHSITTFVSSCSHCTTPRSPAFPRGPPPLATLQKRSRKRSDGM